MKDRSVKVVRAAHHRGARHVPPGTGLVIVAAGSLLIWCLIALFARML